MLSKTQKEVEGVESFKENLGMTLLRMSYQFLLPGDAAAVILSLIHFLSSAHSRKNSCSCN